MRPGRKVRKHGLGGWAWRSREARGRRRAEGGGWQPPGVWGRQRRMRRPGLGGTGRQGK